MEKLVVCSIASWPPRIKYVLACIRSLLNQTVKPDLIMLNCSKLEFPNGIDDFPKELQDLIATEKTIIVTFEDQNIGAFRKEIIPAAKLYGENYFLLTFDDDYVYQEKYIESMLRKIGYHDDYSPVSEGICGGTHIIRGEVLLPAFWKKLTKDIVDTRINDTWTTMYLAHVGANCFWENCPEIMAMRIPNGNAESVSTNCEMAGGYPPALQRRAIELSVGALRR